MRLLTKTTLYFLTAMVILLLIGGLYLFNRFNTELNQKSDLELRQDETAWIEYLSTNVGVGVTYILRTPDISIFPVDLDVADRPAFTDQKDGASGLSYRQLSQVVSIHGLPYQIVIKKSQEQKAALISSITRIILLVFLVLFIATLIFNWAISRNLWKPFYRTLGIIRHTDLQGIQEARFEKTNTTEFNELNTALNAMTAKIHRDYINMKEFIENSAHEMQTPLSIAQTKLELLLQNEELPEDVAYSLLEAENSLSRLSKLNQGLLLLAKIENEQYKTTDTLNLIDVINKYLRLFAEQIQDKQLVVNKQFDHSFIIKMHPLLADSMVANLLGNAIKHNYQGGSLEIQAGVNYFRIGNTTQQSPIPEDKLFQRFSAGRQIDSSSTGLGLAIVKKIVDTHELKIHYQADRGMSTFEVERDSSASIGK